MKKFALGILELIANISFFASQLRVFEIPFGKRVNCLVQPSGTSIRLEAAVKRALGISFERAYE